MKYWTSAIIAAGFASLASPSMASVDHAKIRAACSGEIDRAAVSADFADTNRQVLSEFVNDMIDGLSGQLKSELRRDLSEVPRGRDPAYDLFTCIGTNVLAARAGEAENSGKSNYEYASATGDDEATDAAAVAADAAAAAGDYAPATDVDEATAAEAAEAAGGETPLGLEGTSPAARDAQPERYWLKGRYVETFACGDFCPAGRGVTVVVNASDAYGSRRSGAQYPGDFGFGPPMEAGTQWAIAEVGQSAQGFYFCSLAGQASGTVDAVADSVNAGFAQSVTRVSCDLTDAGKAEVARLRADKAASDARLSGQ